MLKSATYPRDLALDTIDPLLDLYHVEGAEAPEERECRVEASNPPKKSKPRLSLL